MTPTESAASALQDHASLWRVGEGCATDVVSAACDALVAGLDSPALRILAACTRAEADYDVHDRLPPRSTSSASPSFRPAAKPPRKPPCERSHAACWPASWSPGTSRTVSTTGNGHDLALTARLVELDDEYGMLEAEYGDGSRG
ncbi:hypothetical protein [Streptomyces sp. NBC_01294]|uniref:hypothetical protein n=1 Tax=Streptomyces sp. NBC_01294 TaxID=2903815 RepID=UPI002DDB207B|nr:hypothetical protein [Streptomyces sp. NBC_01294]WRZ55150.1 hypothetical protein OG534_00630 [Streptomyces sp. NBC_01294]